MVNLLMMLHYILPQPSDCYLSNNVIDPKSNRDLEEIVMEVSNEENIPLEQVEKILACTKFTKKPKNFVRKVVGTNIPLATSFCDFNQRFLQKARIQKGVQFFNQHQASLEKASKMYGVDPYIITSIIGVETIYGGFLGRAVLKEALVDAYLNAPHEEKKAFFRREVKTFLKLVLNNQVDPKSTSSWDGGMGLAQFMPSSYERYAISFKNETPNMFDVDDAIFSVANYLKNYGYIESEGITQELIGCDEDKDEFDYIDPNTHKPMHVYGMKQNDGTRRYWAKLPNFNSIFEYNKRIPYVINLFLLSQAIKEERENSLEN